MTGLTLSELRIAAATEADVPVLLRLIHALAEYEGLDAQVTATPDALCSSLFGPEAVASAALAFLGDEPVGFAVWFANYSTFLARPGVYLEDLFVVPEWRRRGIGRRLLAHVAAVAVRRGAGRMEWSVLKWNETALRVYRSVGAAPMDEWTTCRLAGDALARLAAEAGT